MTHPARALIAVAGLLGLGSFTEALAQPVVPMRPQYNSYYNMFRPGGGSFYYGYNGAGVYGNVGNIGPFGGQNQMMIRQNAMLQQQLNYNNQSLANLQTYLSTGVNPNLPITGRGATFNYLGHWYPQSQYGGGGGGFGGGGIPQIRGTGTAGGQGILNTGTAGNGRPLTGAGQGPGMIRP